MTRSRRVGVRIVAACLPLACATLARAWTRPSISGGAPTGIAMTRASGTFEVTLNRQQPDDYSDGARLGRMTIDKQLRGDSRGRARARCSPRSLT